MPSIRARSPLGFRCCLGTLVQLFSQPAGAGRGEDHSWVPSSSRVKFQVLPLVKQNPGGLLFQGSCVSWVNTCLQAPAKELSIHRLTERLQGSQIRPKYSADMRIFSNKEKPYEK